MMVKIGKYIILFQIKGDNCENYKTLLGGNYRLALTWVENAVNKGWVPRYEKIQNVEFP